MSHQNSTRNVSEYLDKPPHWLVSHGILLLLLLILAFTGASFFIKVTELRQVNVFLDLSAFEQGLRVAPSLQAATLITPSARRVEKGTPVISVFDLPRTGDQNQSQIAGLPGPSTNRGSINIPYTTLVSPANGIFYYDSLRSTGLVVPTKTQLLVQLKTEDSMYLMRDKRPHQLMLTFEDGTRAAADIIQQNTLPDNDPLTALSFRIPRALSQAEVTSRSLTLKLHIEKSLFASIIEKL